MIDPHEYVRVSRLVYRRSRFVKVWRITAGAVVVGGAATFALFQGTRTFLVPALVGLAVWCLWDALTPPFQRWQVRRALAGLPSLQEPQIYTFDASGLQMQNSLASGSVSWRAIVKVAEADDYFLLYYSDKCAYYLPKRVVGAQYEQLRHLLATQLSTDRLELLSEVPAPAVT